VNESILEAFRFWKEIKRSSNELYFFRKDERNNGNVFEAFNNLVSFAREYV
jgi:hypothetical protein